MLDQISVEWFNQDVNIGPVELYLRTNSDIKNDEINSISEC